MTTMKNSPLDPRIDELAGEILGAAIEVHRMLGAGFLETVYERALAIEFELRGIPFQEQAPVEVYYKGRLAGQSRLDFLVADEVVVELKSVEAILDVHKAQVASYLRSTHCSLGLLINFNVDRLRSGINRIIYTP